MTAAVGDHGVSQSVFAVQPAEQQAENAVEQETAEQDHGCDAEQHCRGGQMTGGEGSVHDQTWITYDEDALVKDEIEIVVQVNGKIKDKINVAAGLDDEAIKAAALENDKVKEATEGKNIVKVIVVKGKLVNIVVK